MSQQTEGSGQEPDDNIDIDPDQILAQSEYLHDLNWIGKEWTSLQSKILLCLSSKKYKLRSLNAVKNVLSADGTFFVDDATLQREISDLVRKGVVAVISHPGGPPYFALIERFIPARKPPVEPHQAVAMLFSRDKKERAQGRAILSGALIVFMVGAPGSLITAMVGAHFMFAVMHWAGVSFDAAVKVSWVGVGVLLAFAASGWWGWYPMSIAHAIRQFSERWLNHPQPASSESGSTSPTPRP